jgi:hypothetical protein
VASSASSLCSALHMMSGRRDETLHSTDAASGMRLWLGWWLLSFLLNVKRCKYLHASFARCTPVYPQAYLCLAHSRHSLPIHHAPHIPTFIQCINMFKSVRGNGCVHHNWLWCCTAWPLQGCICQQYSGIWHDRSMQRDRLVLYGILLGAVA